jgi:ATPase subunit of ABC transporter with duplicated ATPase domains
MSSAARPTLLIDGVSLALPDGRPLLAIPRLAVGNERVGLIGPNGSGKSTLLRLIVGDIVPADGHVARPARVAFARQRAVAALGATVAHGLGLADVLAALARADAGLATTPDLATIGDAWDAPERALAVLDSVGLGHLPLTRAITDISGGEATRLAIAAQMITEPDLLLLDEPTNDLDQPSRRVVESLIGRWTRGLIVATHDRALLQRVDRIVAIERGALRTYGGGWELYHEQREVERAAALRAAANAEAEAQRARRHAQDVRERQARRDAAGRRTRDTGSQPKLVLNAKRERSEGTSGRLNDATARLVSAAEARRREAAVLAQSHEGMTVTLPSCGLAAGTVVIALQDVTAGPTPDVPLLRGVSLTVRGPERVALVGPTGVGKSTLLRLIAGYSTPLSGTVSRGVPLRRVAFLDQHATLLDVGETVLDAFVAQHPQCDINAARAALARFHFRADAALQPVKSLSGGERIRAALACVMAGDDVPQCLVLDEPSNHLDLDHLEGLEAALRAYDGALVVASHDEALLEAIGVTRYEEVGRWR